MKKLSIVTICYNEPNLEKTCESIVNQTWQDFEWVVVDGGSGPETQAVWDKYKYRIDQFVSEKDNGLYNAMNKGIKMATGEYLNFMNAGDCFYDNTVLEKIFQQKEYTEDVLYGDYMLFSKKKNQWLLNKISTDLSTALRSGHPLNHQSQFFKKKLFEKYGLYDESSKIAADYEAFVRFFMKKASFKHINQPVSRFNVEGRSSKQKELTLKEIDIVQRKYFSKEEIEQATSDYDRLCLKYSLLERIFSIRNSSDKKHKIITIFNIHIKISRKRKEKIK